MTPKPTNTEEEKGGCNTVPFGATWMWLPLLLVVRRR